MEWIQNAGLWMFVGMLFFMYSWPKFDRFMRQKYSPEYRQEIEFKLVEPIKCSGCKNVFFVQGCSDEFLPDYCCYCGCELIFDSAEPQEI